MSSMTTLRHDVEAGWEPARTVAVAVFELFADDSLARFSEAFATVEATLAVLGVPITGPAVAVYDTIPDGFLVSAGFVVAGDFVGDGLVEPYELDAVQAVSTLHVGPVERLGEAYDGLIGWAGAHRRRLDESWMWEEFLSGPGVPAEDTLTRVVWPLDPES